MKTKVYTQPAGCFKTYRMATGRVLTSQGLIEDPTVNGIMQEAVAVQMKALNITAAGKSAEMEVRFMGGTGAGLQTDDLMAGDVAIWNIGGAAAVPGRTYKKSSLVMGVVDNRSNQTVWAARYMDNFGDPNKLRERIQNAVAKAFAKFPKNFGCTSGT
ncbi:MAG TPA: DUF4136 domain-containing protein [Bryobacteraceae bacterium]